MHVNRWPPGLVHSRCVLLLTTVAVCVVCLPPTHTYHPPHPHTPTPTPHPTPTPALPTQSLSGTLTTTLWTLGLLSILWGGQDAFRTISSPVQSGEHYLATLLESKPTRKPRYESWRKYRMTRAHSVSKQTEEPPHEWKEGHLYHALSPLVKIVKALNHEVKLIGKDYIFQSFINMGAQLQRLC